MGVTRKELTIADSVLFMNKEELLQELSVKMSTGEISREEIETRLSFTPTAQTAVITEDSKIFTHFSVTKTLYFFGAAVVIIGLAIFVSQIWDDIGSFGRIAVTLGLGFLVTAIGSMLLKSKPDEDIGTVFQFIGGMLIPGGAMVTLSELNVDFASLWPVAITFGIITAFYLLLNSVHKNPILTFFAIANGTAFVYLLVEAIVDGPFYGHEDLYAYLTMVIGASYLSLAHAFRDGWNKKLIGTLHSFGVTGFLGAAFASFFGSVATALLHFFDRRSRLVGVHEKPQYPHHEHPFLHCSCFVYHERVFCGFARLADIACHSRFRIHRTRVYLSQYQQKIYRKLSSRAQGLLDQTQMDSFAPERNQHH